MKTKDTSEIEQKLTVRLSKKTLEQLRRLAVDHQRSLNGEIVWALQFYIVHERNQANDQVETSTACNGNAEQD